MFLKEHREYRAVVYPEQKKIACVLLQAVFGGDSIVPQAFDTKHWAVSPLPNPKPFTDTGANWMKLAERWDKEANGT